MDESVASALYLLKCGVPENLILTETASFDTIGNAYFSRVIHIDPLGLTRLLVITSDFHLARARAIFRWVYSLSGGDHELTFQGVPDVGISEASLRARIEKERHGLEGLTGPMSEIKTLKQLQQWLFLRHAAYNLESSRSNIGDAIDTYQTPSCLGGVAMNSPGVFADLAAQRACWHPAAFATPIGITIE